MVVKSPVDVLSNTFQQPGRRGRPKLVDFTSPFFFVGWEKVRVTKWDNIFIFFWGENKVDSFKSGLEVIFEGFHRKKKECLGWCHIS